MAAFKVVAVDENNRPQAGVNIYAVSLNNYPNISEVVQADLAGEAFFTGLVGPHFFWAQEIRTSTTVGERVYSGRLHVQITSFGQSPCFDYVVDANGMGTHTSLTAVSADLDASSVNGGAYNVWLCGITTESVTLTYPASKWLKLYVFGGGWQHSGITGSLILNGTEAAGHDVQFQDCSIPTVSATGGGSHHPRFTGCKIDTITNSAVVTIAWSGLELRDCLLGTLTAGANGVWDNTLIARCKISGSIDLDATRSGDGIQITDNWFTGAASQISLNGPRQCQITENRWQASPATATVAQIAVVTSATNYTFGLKIENNTFQNVVAAGSTISFTGTGGFLEAAINGNTFAYGGGSPTNFITGASGVTIVATITGNNFETRTTTPTFLETDGGISISGLFKNSTFGPNTPSDFDVELLAGSANNLYIGLGTVSGAGASSATVIASDAQFLTLAAHDGLPNERVFTPRNNAFGTDGGAGAKYTLDSWLKGGDIASANPLILGSDGDYFHVTGTTGIGSISGYNNAVLADSPAAYYRMGESSGQPQDSSGNAQHTTAVGGTPTYSQTGAISGDADTAILLDGSTEYFTTPDSATLDLLATFTIEAWVKRSATGTIDTIVSKGANGYQLRINASDKLELLKENVASLAVSTPTIDTNWHHVAATKTSGAAPVLYIDGVAVALDSSATTDTADTALVLSIGRRTTLGDEYFIGTLDEVALYPTALSAARILAHYNAAIAPVAGARVLLEFDGACLLTHSASLILQGAVNFTTAAGDVMEFVFEGSGVWREIARHVAAAAGASSAEPFVTVGNTAGLSAERALTGGSGVGFTDNGANSSIVAALANLSATWAQAGVFNIEHAGNLLVAKYARVGSLSAPTNTTDGDLTAIRGIFGSGQDVILDSGASLASLRFDGSNDKLEYNQAANRFSFKIADVAYAAIEDSAGLALLQLGVSASKVGRLYLSAAGLDSGQLLIEGDGANSDWRIDGYGNHIRFLDVLGMESMHVGATWLRHVGYGRFGSLSAPTNTTNGDLTAERLIVPDATVLTGLISQLGGPVGIPNQGEMRWYDTGSSNYVGIKADSARTTDLVYILPATDPTVGQVLQASAPVAGVVTLSWVAAGGHAAVTLAADADAVLSLSTQEIGLDTQTANTVFAGPTSGGAADPTFRALVAADVPNNTVIGEHEITVTVENPTASENIIVRQFTRAITITAIQAVVIGGTSVTIDPEHGSTITTATKLLSAPEVVASASTTGEHIGGTGTAMAASFNDATLAAGDFLRLETTAISGTPTQLSVTFKYRLT